MDTTGQKSRSKTWKWLFIIVGAIILAYALFFIYQVFSIRSQILSGTYDFDQYGAAISGSGGANVELNRAYQVATDDDPSIGPADAAVTIVEFGDYECPFCLRAFPVIRSLVSEYPRDVRLVWRDFPLADIHPNAELAARAGYCAEAQGRFWALHDKLFQNQTNLSEAAINAYAEQVGIAPAPFAACLDSGDASQEVRGDYIDGRAAGVLGTPTWFINGIRVAGVIPEGVFRQIIEDLLEDTRNKKQTNSNTQ